MDISELRRELRRVSNFNQSMKLNWPTTWNLAEVGNLTKFEASRVNSGQVMDFETSFEIYRNVSKYETASYPRVCARDVIKF